MQLACTLITHFRAKAELARRPELQSRPFVIIDPDQPGKPVLDRSPQAGRSPETKTTVLWADHLYYSAERCRIAESLASEAGTLEDAGLGETYIEFDGLTRLYGGPEGAAARLLSALPNDFAPRIGIAGSKFVSYVSALRAAPRGVNWAPPCPRALLDPMPTAVLPVSDRLKASLARLGVLRLGQIYRAGPGPMNNRFGIEGLLAWELSAAIDRRPLVVQNEPASLTEHTSLPPAAASTEIIRLGLELLLKRAYGRPALKDRGASLAKLSAIDARGREWNKSVRMKEPAGDADRALRLIWQKICSNLPTEPPESLSLTLSDFGLKRAVQGSLLTGTRDISEDRLAQAGAALSARLGPRGQLYRPVLVAPWHPAPEMRSLLIPLDPRESGSVRSTLAPTPVKVSEETCGERKPTAVRLASRWVRIEKIEDHWTFDLWWLPHPIARTYYRAVTEDGASRALYRDETTGLWHSQKA